MDSFKTRKILAVAGKTFCISDLSALSQQYPAVKRLPISLKILLENLLRHEDGEVVTKEDIEAVINWQPDATPTTEIAFHPARVLLQDFTGVPAVVDLAGMRDAMVAMGGDANLVNPLQPVDLVIDHSVVVDSFGRHDAFATNTALEMQRNLERYRFLRWGQAAFDNFRVVPPGTGIVHQVNLEYLGRVVFAENGAVYPDSLVGTDSHTTMINGLGIVGWGVGGIEAEAAMLGQPVSMLLPQVVGFKLDGVLPAGTTATDLVLTVVQMLREKGVVGKFVEFYGDGLSRLSLADRAIIANMGPEYGATIGFFPVDRETLAYLRFTNRDHEQVEIIDTYCRRQGLLHSGRTVEPIFSDSLSLDLGDVVPSIAGPKRPQDRIPLTRAKAVTREILSGRKKEIGSTTQVTAHGTTFDMPNAAVVIAAITSCTNTSNPAVMLAAGLLARAAVEKGLTTKPWVKTSLAPGSKVVTDYLREAGLLSPLESLGFHLVGYGCTTCIGNSGPLPEEISQAIREDDMVVAAVLSGNRNFEGRVHPQTRMNFLASPPLVVAYALAGSTDIDFDNEPIGADNNGRPVYLRDIWPSPELVSDTIRAAVKTKQFANQYARVFEGDERWRSLEAPTGKFFVWDESSTYVRKPPFFIDLPAVPTSLCDIEKARVLAVLGDSVTTDHISPAGAIPKEGPAGRYLMERGVEPADFNSFGSRRGNHEVMMRGTFANIRLRNQLVPGVEGGYTRYHPTSEQMSIFDAAEKYRTDGTPLVVIAGSEYGTGSSRDWAAKGTRLLGVKAVFAKSFERIHRSNLIGMGVLPLQFAADEDASSLRLTGDETFTIHGIAVGLAPGKRLAVSITSAEGNCRDIEVLTRIDTPNEVSYYRHGGILPFVLRQLLQR